MGGITRSCVPRRKKWILGTAAGAVLLAAAALFLFGINRFRVEIRLTGAQEVSVEYGEHYHEPGAVAVLKGTRVLTEGKPLDAVQVRLGGSVDETAVGKYVLTYSARYYWWESTAQRTVRVVDTQCPVITLVESGGEHLPGTVYEEEGFTATDNVDGDITHRVIRTEEPGKITYAVLDSSGNPAFAHREVPYHDPIPPRITLNGGEYMAVNVGTAFLDPGYTAADNVDGDITERVTAEGAVDGFRPGTYYIRYTVSDNYQNTASVTRTVEVVAQPRPETVMPREKTIYLTFDDGPGPYTQQLLDVLDQYGIKATFFVIDTGYDEVMKEIVDRGHSIGIHSVTHNYEEIYASPEAYFADLIRMQNVICENTGVKTTLMRFPGGSSNTVSCEISEGIMSLLTEAVQDAGFQYFDWNVDSNDAGGARRAETVFRNVTEGIARQPVSVVLQHDIAPFSVEAVEKIIVWGLENGYTFLPLQENSPGMHHGVNN